MRMHRALAALLTVLMWAAGEAAPGTATISGTVVGLSSDQPIGGATVTIFAPQFPDGRQATLTDTQGRFTFSGLAPGRYTIAATKSGFVNVIHGQRKVGGAGRAVPVRDGEHQRIRLKLPRTSVITGVVVDEGGSPAVNASVRALRYTMAFGYRRANTVGTSTTDDRGIYRIHSLQPGDYAVCASTRSTSPLNEAQRLRMEIDEERRRATYVLGPAGAKLQRDTAPRLAALERRLPPYVDPVFGYGHVCHPGTGALPSMVRVAPEEERTAVDLQFARSRLARVEGIVTGVPGPDTEIDPIMLINLDETADSTESVRSDVEGRFVFTNVRPGQYRLLLHTSTRGGQPGVRLRADADVTVAGDDVDNVVLPLQKHSTLTGQIVLEGIVLPPAGVMAKIHLGLSLATRGPLSRHYGSSPVVPDETGRFALSNIAPGEYLIWAGSTDGSEWFLDAATIAGQNIQGQPLAIRANENLTDVVLTLTNRRAQLAGTIVNAQGEPAPEYLILVYSAEERYWTGPSRRMPSVRAKPDGSYAVTGLQAGSYRVAMLLDVEFGAWFEPAFLRQLESASIPLTIAEGEKKALNLRVPE